MPKKKHLTERINLQLSPELAAFVEEEVAKQAFGAKTEYLRHLVREAMLRARERDALASKPSN